MFGAFLAGNGQAGEEETIIRKTVESYVASFNAGDAAALAELWARDAEFITPSGETVQGREQILKSFETFFKENEGAKLEVDIASIRAEDTNTIIEEGTARVTFPDESVSETNYVARYAKQDDKWLMTNVRESDKAPSHYEQLKGLEWMIGEWIDRDEKSSVRTTCKWTKNKNFISRSFAVSFNDQIDLEGTQVIGWDPSRQVIRSWMFDSDGGFGVGVWSPKGNRWTIRALRVLPDGRKASAVNVLTYVDENTFTWASTGREVDGEILPNLGPITVVRR
jgi:uncharacterized protein (TIGR02246 family)